MTLLETKGLTRVYGGLTAVGNVDFALPEGQIHALIGPNGAGKSTFVGMVSGRIPASSGEVWFDGTNITALPAHARIRMGMAYTFQITAVFTRLSLLENVGLALGNRNRARALDALDRVGLADKADQSTNVFWRLPWGSRKNPGF
jgi:branched-chain amino acid transport system ATP-binding protein